MTTVDRGARKALMAAAAAALAIVVAGCAAQAGIARGPDAGARDSSRPASEKKIDELTASLQAAKRDLAAAREEGARSHTACEAKTRDLELRLKAVEAAHANAVKEVLRLRDRIGTLAAEPETGAMFAEARVIVDRMQEEAYNDTAKGLLLMAQKYLKEGKQSMDGRNFGGAAFLFEMITATYQDFKKASPRTLTVLSGSVILRVSPVASAEKAGAVEQGAVVEGVEKREGWYRVRAPSGLSGWLRKESVR